MSAEIPEPWELELLFNGEGSPASDEDIEVMETIALELVDSLPAVLDKDESFINTETGASLYVSSTRSEDIFQPLPVASMVLSRDDEELPRISVSFGPRNDIVYLGYDSEGDFAEIQRIAAELLIDPLFEERPRAIVECICAIAAKLMANEVGMVSVKEIDESLAHDTPHIADVTRGYLDDLLGDQSLSIKDYGLYLGDNRVVGIIKRDYLDFRSEEEKTEDDDPDEDDFEVPIQSLHITLEERNQGLGYHYFKTSDGKRVLEVMPVDQEFEIDLSPDDAEDRLIGNEVSDMTEKLHIIRATDVELVTKGLMDALALDSEVLPRVGNKWSYPELRFGFNFAPNSEQTDLLREAMRSLGATTQYMLPERCPAGFPPQPNYTFSPNKYRRVENFMRQKVSASYNSDIRVPRYSIVDLHTAAEVILEELSEQNHPVSQMVAQLYDEYGLQLGFDTVEQVAVGVIMYTHWGKLRNHLASQVQTWRNSGRVSGIASI